MDFLFVNRLLPTFFKVQIIYIDKPEPYGFHQKVRIRFNLVEVVRVELTSYAAAKKLSTCLVYLLFLNFVMRVNTLYKTQKAEYSYKNAFRSLQEASVCLTPHPRPTDRSGATIRYKTKLRCKSVVCIIICIYI